VDEHFQLRHLWVLLSGFPLHLWNEGAFEGDWRCSGVVHHSGYTTLEKYVRKVGRILVEVDIHGGLIEELDIEWRGRLSHSG
jgi:hypothetical protein